jgi:hypothetical protein
MVKNFVDGLGISEERVKQINEMATQTFMTGMDIAAGMDMSNAADTPKNQNLLYGNITKLMLEDVKLLSGVEEGIVYGYIMNEHAADMRQLIREELAKFNSNMRVTVISPDDLVGILGGLLDTPPGGRGVSRRKKDKQEDL